MKHVHYDLIKQWAEDPQRYKVYCRVRDAVGHIWNETKDPAWHERFEYKLVSKPQSFRVRRYILNERDKDWLFMHTDGHYYDPENMPGFVRWVDPTYYDLTLQ